MIEKGKENRELARYAAAQGMVLLKNDGDALPLEGLGVKVAVFGIGQIHTFKGGTGSGDVNNRTTVSILRGLRENPGFSVDETIASFYEDWALSHPAVYEYAVCKTASYEEPSCEKMDIKTAASQNDAAIVVISHTSGEDSDRTLSKGDYYLSDNEELLIKAVHTHFKKTIVLLNTCGVIDLKLVEPYCEAILYVSMPGQEGGHVVADILSGAVTPSGKLTDSWAVNWRDYPSSACFGAERKNGNWNTRTHGKNADAAIEQAYVEYQEGIYNGYRYFDTFGVRTMYPFGYGLSYTKFVYQMVSFDYRDATVNVQVSVKNVGKRYSGREVIQLYVSAPDGKVEKPAKELKSFAKTRELRPGETGTVTLTVNCNALASYSEEQSCYLLESGYYDFYIGNCIAETECIGTLLVERELCVSRHRAILPRQHSFPLLSKVVDRIEKNQDIRNGEKIPVLRIRELDFKVTSYAYSTPSGRKAVQTSGNIKWADVVDEKASMQELVAQMDISSMAELVCGIGTDLFGINDNFVIGNIDKGLVPGCAGMTRENKEFGIPAIVLADGPAGIRLHRDVKDENGEVVMHQNCTAYPVGTLLASSWDTDLLYQVGQSVGEEMQCFGVDLWLAPGMNIHRNPLCGRNFEYYSEDPYLTGKMAAAITKGVQSCGVGVTVKHMAVNNQEDMRANCDSRIDERTLREIYLKGFEMVIREAAPWAVMTSYNDINGIPAADSYDLCTRFARDECGHDGLIMTDWGGGLSYPLLNIYAGNDMIQPGGRETKRNIEIWCDSGKTVRSKGEQHFQAEVTRAMLEDCLVRILNVVKRCKHK